MTAVLSAASLTFEPETHTYRRGDGRVVPSVTEILRAVGVSVDFDALAGVAHRVAQAIDLKRDIGTALHLDAHAFDDNDLDWTTVDPRVEPYLRAWVTFRDNTGLVPVVRERRVYHPVFSYAGTLDGIFRAPTGTLVLVDLKVGDPADAAAHLQTAAYEAAYRAEHGGEPITDRWAVRLCPELRVPYRVSKYTDWRDFQKFQACLTVFFEQPTRRT